MSFGISNDNDFDFNSIDFDETPMEKLLIISTDNKFYQAFQILDIFF